uniref:VMP25 n=1 Tax=Heliconius melpomene TaxID=34740 RepID=J7G1X0_HELME|nr:VMP25 [Heliconius melpomene]
MFKKISTVLIFAFISCVRCHLLLDASKRLQPVHGLYVKPSTDGTTGDLYVAATEDTGVKSQWLTDQPINFLPTSKQKQTSKIPVSLSSTLIRSSSSNEGTVTTQKKAVVTSPALKYAHGGEGNLPTLYPHAIPSTTKSFEGSNVTPCPSEFPAHAYSPYFYPYMISALANAINALKDLENSEENSPTVVSQPTAQWPHPYAYPYQYIMIDPNAWSNPSNQNAAPSSIPNETSNESS